MAEQEIRPVRESDLADVVDIIRRSKAEWPFERPPTSAELKTWTFGNDEFMPEGSWLLRTDGGLVGYSFALVEMNRLTAGFDDAYFEFELVPEMRGKGHEQRLVRLACEYIRLRGVAKARTRSLTDDSWRLGTLSSEGFAETYTVYYLVRKGPRPVGEVPLPGGVRLVRRPYKECGDEELTRIVEAFNDTFQDHIGFSPERPETFIRYRDAGEDPECFSLAMEGDEIVGVCLSMEERVYNRERGTKWGWVNILGVRPPHRGRGIGKSLLADGMRWILEQGMDTMYIGVFAKNEKALELYKSVGFETDRSSKWFEKQLA